MKRTSVTKKARVVSFMVVCLLVGFEWIEWMKKIR